MNSELLKQLARVTEKEAILAGKELDMSKYSDSMPSLVDSCKLLEVGKLFTIRPNMRFIAFLKRNTV